MLVEKLQRTRQITRTRMFPVRNQNGDRLCCSGIKFFLG